MKTASWLAFRPVRVVGVVIWLIGGAAELRAEVPVTILHSFGFSPPGSGNSPTAGLALVDSTLFGTTNSGGAGFLGTVFSMQTDGTGYTQRHSFDFNNNDAYPEAGLVRSGSLLYGTTSGISGLTFGSIYSLHADGTNFNVEHWFEGSDGSSPQGQLTQVGSRFYGTTLAGGDHNLGTVFSFDPANGEVTVLHHFADGPNDGQEPYGGNLTAIGSTLYGTTTNGGLGLGTLYRVNTDGSGYEILHDFGLMPQTGYGPNTGVTLAGSKLYGTTNGGGAFPGGGATLYSINPDGTGHTVLHEFVGNDGSLFSDDLTLAGSKLYGMTRSGGTSFYGTLFSINTDGSGFTVLHNFAGGANDGNLPLSALVSDGSNLYGTTLSGGAFNLGTVFAIAIPEPASWLSAVMAFALVSAAARTRIASCDASPRSVGTPPIRSSVLQ